MGSMLGIIITIVVLVIIIGMYNGLIGRRNQVDNVFGTIDAMLKKRHDLIPNLIATVQQYMTHERELLTRLTELRGLAGSASPGERVAIENELTGMLGRIMAVAESYPDLRSSQNFLHLQASLNEVEEQISAARRAYNAAVTDYNNAVQMFPSSLMAGAMGLQPRRVFEIPEVERQNVDVQALFRR